MELDLSRGRVRGADVVAVALSWLTGSLLCVNTRLNALGATYRGRLPVATARIQCRVMSGPYWVRWIDLYNDPAAAAGRVRRARVVACNRELCAGQQRSRLGNTGTLQTLVDCLQQFRIPSGIERFRPLRLRRVPPCRP